jgi:hypothetical protein
MSCRIQFNILEFDEKGFSWEPQAGSVILKNLRFAYLKIIGFEPSKVEVGDIAITIIHVRFFSKVAIWLKTRVGSNGWQWVLI